MDNALATMPRLQELELEFENCYVASASAMVEAYRALAEIRDEEYWKDALDEDGYQAFRTFEAYLGDFQTRLQTRNPDVHASYTKMWESLQAVRIAGALGVDDSKLLLMSDQTRHGFLDLAEWNRKTGEPLRLKGGVKEDELPAGGTLTERLRAVVENIVEIAATEVIGKKSALFYVRNQLNGKPELDWSLTVYGNRITRISATVSDVNGIRTYDLFCSGTDFPDYILEDIHRKFRVPYKG